MMSLRARLPPLDAHVAFEAAARLSSFTAAARELNVSQSAVSQQIRALEASLGTALFVRAGRRVRPTPAGRAYRHSVARALEQIANATRELRALGAPEPLTLAADQSISWFWLMPRLPAFRARHPESRIRRIASDSARDCLEETVALAILHGRGDWPGREARLLFPEEVFPVCSPDYLVGAPPLAEPADLLRHRLLHLEDDGWQWLNWRMWLTEAGLDAPAERHGLIMNNYPLLIEAAKAGQGVALGWRTLVDADLAAGRLVRPLEGTVRTDGGYYLLWPAGREIGAAARLLAGFLAGEEVGREARG